MYTNISSQYEYLMSHKPRTDHISEGIKKSLVTIQTSGARMSDLWEYFNTVPADPSQSFYFHTESHRPKRSRDLPFKVRDVTPHQVPGSLLFRDIRSIT